MIRFADFLFVYWAASCGGVALRAVGLGMTTTTTTTTTLLAGTG